MWAVSDRAARIARRYGYRYVETPVFEHTELFARTSGETSDVVNKEMYTFEDRRGRSLTLRPEGTAPVMRAYLNDRHRQALPFKAFYLTRMYRYGRPQAGRFREHRQFGIETFGVEGPDADVETLVVGDRFLRELGLSRYRVELNSVGDGNCRPAYRVLLLSYLEANQDRLRDEHRDRFADNPLRVLDCKDEACRSVAAGAPAIIDHLCDACRAHFAGVREGLAAEGITSVVTPTLVRGLDYYTRTAFEFVSEVLSEAQGTLFGGGRYDGLSEQLGGPPLPGVGFGMGLERVLLALADEGVAPPEAPGLDAFVVGVGDEAGPAARTVVRSLRDHQINADLVEGRSLKGQLRAASRTGARFAAIVGASEIRTGTVTLRDLRAGTEEQLALPDAIERIRRPETAP
jgi:histidyl-tRNA synthetase